MELRSFESIELAVRGCFGEDVTVLNRTYVGGGDINDACCLVLSNGQKVFVKSNTISNRGFFDAECHGLNAIASTRAIATPDLICIGNDHDRGISFLMMEMIESGKPAPDRWEVLGRELASMHNADTESFVADKGFGFESDNYIGASKQINSRRSTWIDFFRDCRLEPQFKMASGYFDKAFTAKIIQFLDKLDDLLTEPSHPSLLHGDLWSGNIITGPSGRMMLIDPAVYVGHAEADLAMTELFGRLPQAFYESYRMYADVSDGYEHRRDIYNLYHLLNHLNLFGRSYLRAVEETVNGVLCTDYTRTRI